MYCLLCLWFLKCSSRRFAVQCPQCPGPVARVAMMSARGQQKTIPVSKDCLAFTMLPQMLYGSKLVAHVAMMSARSQQKNHSSLNRLPGFHKIMFFAPDSIWIQEGFFSGENGDNLIACSQCLSLRHCKTESHLWPILDNCVWPIVGNWEVGVKLDGKKIPSASSPH